MLTHIACFQEKWILKNATERIETRNEGKQTQNHEILGILCYAMFNADASKKKKTSCVAVERVRPTRYALAHVQ